MSSQAYLCTVERAWRALLQQRTTVYTPLGVRYRFQSPETPQQLDLNVFRRNYQGVKRFLSKFKKYIFTSALKLT